MPIRPRASLSLYTCLPGLLAACSGEPEAPPTVSQIEAVPTGLEVAPAQALPVPDLLAAYHRGEAAEQAGRLEEAALAYGEVIAGAGLEHRLLTLRTLFRKAYVHNELEQFNDSLAAYEEYLALAAETGNSGGTYTVHNNLGLVYRSLGHADRSFEHLRASYDASRTLTADGTCGSTISAPFNLVIEYVLRGDYGTALSLLDETRTRFAGPSDLDDARVRYLDATVAGAVDGYGSAEPAYREALAAYNRLGEARHGAWTTLGLARVAARWHADFAASDHYSAAAEEGFVTTGDLEGQWSARLGRFESALAARDLELARARLDQAWEIGAQLDPSREVTRAELAELKTRLAHAADDYDTAFVHGREALTGYRAVGSLPAQGGMYALLASISGDAGGVRAAIELSREAVRVFEALDATDDIAQVRADLAVILAKNGELDEAYLELSRAEAVRPVHTYETALELRVAKALVAQYAGDSAAPKLLAAARRFAADRGDRRSLLDIDRVAREAMDATRALATAPVTRATPVAAPVAVAAPVVVAPAPVAAPTAVLALAPALATVTTGGDAPARYRFLLANLTAEPRVVDLSLSGAPAELGVGESDSTRADFAGLGTGTRRVSLSPYATVPVVVEAAPGDPGGLSLVRASDASGGTSVTAAFETRIDGALRGRTADTTVGGVDWDTSLRGVTFYHAFDAAGAELLPVKVVASGACYAELYDGRTGELVAVDAEGDGSFHGPGDSIHADADGDRRPDLAATDGVASLVLVVYPEREASGELSLTVTGGDAAPQRDVVMP